MTPEAMRIAIAEACGWKWIKSENANTWAWFDGRNNPGDRWQVFSDKNTDGLPNYPADLNAMHEVVKTLTPVQQYHYSRWLDEVTEPVGPPRFQEWSPIRISHATALQRAEAFLRTIGKWVEE